MVTEEDVLLSDWSREVRAVIEKSLYSSGGSHAALDVPGEESTSFNIRSLCVIGRSECEEERTHGERRSTGIEESHIVTVVMNTDAVLPFHTHKRFSRRRCSDTVPVSQMNSTASDRRPRRLYFDVPRTKDQKKRR